MASSILVTAEVAGRSGLSETVIEPGPVASGSVVLTTEQTLRRWPAPLPSGVCWVVLSEGGHDPLPLEPFLLLPAGLSGPPLARALLAALETASLRHRLQRLHGEAQAAQDRQLELARIGIALVAERDLARLLERILSSARELVCADAGSLYLLEEREGHKLLHFMLAQNDSVPVALSTWSVPVDTASIAGFVAASGDCVAVEDVRYLPRDAPYSFNPRFDQLTGYHTRSLLTVPMATRTGEIVGVLQLINRKRDRLATVASAQEAEQWVIPFSQADIAVIRALAAQAAVAIENSRLVGEIQRLFESFVRAAVMAIEQRDPTTRGHSVRVAHFTLGLARAVEQNPPPAYRHLRFSRDDLLQLRYAALLHDFGKVGVREAVLTKPKKLYPDRLQLILERFRHARRAQEVLVLRKLLEQLVALGRAPTGEDLRNLEAAVQVLREDLDLKLARVLEANEPTVLEASTAHLLHELAGTQFPGEDGEPLPLLTPEEVRWLSVPKGSLDEEERREVESHVVHSYQFLLTIPWPKRLARVPEIAYGHHEKLDGRGYPRRLRAEEIPPEVRMMTICDMYDALTAADRPYKKAVSPERALAILDEDAQKGALDRDLFRVFLEARVFASPPPSDALS
ncbi:MAG: GAF domain-containing protein [Thermoanaerobaculum sp.]|nr:GAF domain-containing protein [Thermoanaerobaculum sp.]MDW7967756.1 HD domain-containing phosphohydrolase [Thermoanaerobaculum sp.]